MAIIRGSLKLLRDPHIYDKFGHGGPQNYFKMGMGVPILWGSPFLLDTGMLVHENFQMAMLTFLISKFILV